MKKVFSLMLFVTSFICFTACSNDEDEFYTPQEVNLTLDYTFVESGSMTRATGESVYNDFYEKYIKSKQLTPTTYTLTFKNKNTGATTAIVNGVWGNKDAIRLPEGDYEVVGTSTPQSVTNSSIDECVSDTVFLSFSENVHITKDMTNLTLTAKYNSYLLMFDNENCNNVSYGYNTYSKELNLCDKVYTLFIERLTYGNSYNIISITRKDGNYVNIFLEGIPFEKGKYYYFNDMTNSFDIPKMESGN